MARLSLIFLILLLSNCAGLESEDRVSRNAADEMDVCPITSERMPIVRCLQLSTKESEKNAMREWLRGPMMQSCAANPGPKSRLGCALVNDHHLAILRGESPSREDRYRMELAKARGFDEVSQLWTKAEREHWLRAIRTQACQQAPVPAEVRQCLEGVESDLDVLSRPDDLPVDSPEVRAIRAVERQEAKQRQLAEEYSRKQQQAFEGDQQRRAINAQIEAARIQAVGQALMGLGMSGGILKSPVVVPQQPAIPPAPLFAPVAPVPPPVNCTSHMVGGVVSTSCY